MLPQLVLFYIYFLVLNNFAFAWGIIHTSGAVAAKNSKFLSATFPISFYSVFGTCAINNANYSNNISELYATNATWKFKNSNTNNSDSTLTIVFWIVWGRLS